MKKRIFSLLILLGLANGIMAQITSCATFLRARQKADVVVPFRVLDEGRPTPIEWGLDLAWLDEGNIRRGVNFAGKDLIDIVRTSYTATESVEEGVLSDSMIYKIQERANIIKRFLKPGVGININHDHGEHPAIDVWYNAKDAGSAGRGERWAELIDLTIKKYAELGVTNLVSISPYNEPDLGWGQGYSDATRMADFLAIAKVLKPQYKNARLCGGNTLNDDKALDWWNYLKEYLDEGNTHQLAGSFDNYASFFQQVRKYGHHATADELHNTMEAMVGVEYGMQTGIWWGTCEHSRSQFMKATYHAAPGRRLAYGEHRNNWTAASVYRHTDGSIQAFGGTSERQAVATSYNFACLDRPVWYKGEAGREYVMALPGGTGYQNGQTNAETVVDIQSGTDIMPHIDGTYKVMNVNSGLLLGFNSTPGKDWVSAIQKGNSNYKYLQWIVMPMPTTCGGDFSYHSFMLNAGDSIYLDILNWNLNAGADVGGFHGALGTNEQWYLEYAGEGAFYIRSRFSAKCLEVKNGSTTVGINIQMGEYSGGKHQQWRFIPTNVTPDLTAPNAPTALTATGQGSSVRLDWEASTSKDVASYTILRSEDGSDYYAIATGVTGTSFTDNEAQDEIQHHYKLYAIDKCYNYSEQTEAVTAAPTAEPDIVVNLPFDYTMNDTTSNGNHAALYGSPLWMTGTIGSAALRLNGSNNFIQLPYTVANHDELTIACWVYWRGGNTWQRLWDFGTGTNQYMFFTPKSDSGMRFAIKNEGSEQQIRVSRNLIASKWMHVAVTIGSNGACIYINGELQGSNDAVTIRPSDIRPVFNYIGRSQFADDPMFNGYIDDFRIYNRALDAQAIKAIVEMADGIDTPQDSACGSSEAYDLSGRRIHQVHQHRGIMVRNGRKVMP